MRKAEWFMVIMAVVFFVTGALFYPYLPTQVASHWDSAGQVNGHLPKFWGAFLLPIIFVFLAVLFILIPRIDPRRENIKKFISYFDYFIITFTLFFYYIFLLTLLPNIGVAIDMRLAITVPMAVLFYVIGIILPKLKSNFLIGIRTPWTLSSETVWQKTHEFGGPLFKLTAIIALFGVLFPAYAFWLLIAPIVVAAIWLTIYSYILYEKEKK